MRFKEREQKQDYKVFSLDDLGVFNFLKKLAHVVPRETVFFCSLMKILFCGRIAA